MGVKATSNVCYVGSHYIYDSTRPSAVFPLSRVIPFAPSEPFHDYFTTRSFTNEQLDTLRSVIRSHDIP